MGALSSLTFSGELYLKAGQYVEDAVAITAAMTDADFSGKHLGSPGAIILAAWLSSDKGALSFLDISSNKLWENWIFSSDQWYLNGYHPPGYPNGGCKEKPEETNQGFLAMCDAIRNMGALSTCVMRQNDIHGAEAGRAFADMLAQNAVLKELDLSSQKVGRDGKALDAAFAKEFAVGISGNGALTSLNLSSNDIGGHWDNNRHWIDTPEGMFVVVAIFVPHSRCIQCRPSCYR
jgi:hypothetical protein